MRGNDNPSLRSGFRIVLRLVMVAVISIVILGVRITNAADYSSTGKPSEDEAQSSSMTELNKKLTNPVSSTWSLSFQQNNYYLQNPGAWNSNLQFQPVLPVSLTKDWNLITRPVLQLFNSTPYPSVQTDPVTLQPRVETKRTTGFGDTILLEMLSPSPDLVGNWLLGLGPTFIFPSATTDYTGQGKWQAGPGAVVGYLSHKWILGAFVQNWTSFAGDNDREDTNQMNLQPIAAYFFGEGWSIGYSGNVLANWKANSDNVWTVPIGVGISKVVKLGRLPVKLSLAGQYMPIHPDCFWAAVEYSVADCARHSQAHPGDPLWWMRYVWESLPDVRERRRHEKEIFRSIYAKPVKGTVFSNIVALECLVVRLSGKCWRHQGVAAGVQPYCPG